MAVNQLFSSVQPWDLSMLQDKKTALALKIFFTFGQVFQS